MASSESATLLIVRPPCGQEEIVRRARLYAVEYGVPGDCSRVKKTALGKPYFPDMPALRLSVSHSDGLWALALSQSEIGVDLQAVRPCQREAVARRFFHPEEARYIASGPEDRFFAVWTAKESYVKYTGEGITDGFREFSVVQDGRMRDFLHGARLRFVPTLPGYFLCLCGGEEALSIEISGLPSSENKA